MVLAASRCQSTARGFGDRVPLDLREAGEYDSRVKVQSKQTLRASQFLRLRAGDMVLVHAKGVKLAKVCEADGIPYRVVKGLYVEVGASLVSSSRNCVAVKRAQLARLKKVLGKRSVSAASTRGASHR
jgi:siroheme synthase